MYLYTVYVSRPIIGLSIGELRTPKSLMLSKEDVLKCIQSAPVYRRFSANNSVKVTPLNIDRLHNENFMTEEEYEKFLSSKLSENRGKVEEIKVDNTKEDEATEEVVDEPVEEQTQTNEVAEEVTDESDNEAIEENQTDEIAEEASDDNSSEEVKDYNRNSNNKYNRKKYYKK